MIPWTILDRACGVGPGLIASLSWVDRIDVLRRSAVLRSRQGWSWLRTAAQVVWYRHVLRGRVAGLPLEVLAGEEWHRIEGEAAARQVAAAQDVVPAERCLADIFIRTEHAEPCWCALDERGRLTALLFHWRMGTAVFILRYPPKP